MRYRVAHDANHRTITAALRKAGWWHMDVSRFLGLGCDILTKHKDGYPLLLEVKTPGREKRLTESERALREVFPMFFRIVATPEEAFRAVGFA